MAMGQRKRQEQDPLWIWHEDLPRSQGHPYYEALNQILNHLGFDDWVEAVCQPFYHESLGRPSVAPGVYFRSLMIGYLEGIDSERGIAWRCADSLSLRQFLGIAIDENGLDHSSLSRTRRLIDLETHQRVFQWILKLLGTQGLVQGKTVGIDATTLEANAALRSIVRRDTGESYNELLTRLAQASGIDTPTRQDLAKLDKKRKNKGSNDDWQHPHDPDAKITKMKDGRTHLAHKHEHAVDFESGAALAVTVQPADEGDTTTWRQTAEEACRNLNVLKDDPLTCGHVNGQVVEELVEDKGYHSNQTMMDLQEIGIRSYVSEPDRGRRNWKDKQAQRDAVYANRRRIKGKRGKQLLRQRGELLERGFAHELDTGGMRCTHLRGHENLFKRMLIHVGGFNLGLMMRRVLGVGKPKVLQSARLALLGVIGACCRLERLLPDLLRPLWTASVVLDRRFRLCPTA